MYRLAVTIIFSSVTFAQNAPDPEVALSAKSPRSLARYVDSHRSVDWKALRSALNLEESPYWFAPCGSDAPANQARCATETVTVANPNQSIVIIRSSDDFSFRDEYLRYLQGPNGDWMFAGENSADKRFGPSNHEFVRLGTKPFLKISSNHSQNGAAIQQEIEDWFDLTLPGFEPAFSFTTDGSAGGFVFTIVRVIKAQSRFSRSGSLERIETTVNVRFEGTPGLDVQGSYLGVYERNANEKKFTLRAAYSGLDRRTKIPAKDFEDLANPFADPASETFMINALSGLKRIAAGSNADDRAWLRDLLDHAKDTSEKRMLLELLAKPAARPSKL